MKGYLAEEGIASEAYHFRELPFGGGPIMAPYD